MTVEVFASPVRATHIDTGADSPAEGRRRWLTRGVAGIGSTSFLAEVGHEVPTALLPSLVTSTLGGSAAALGVIEGVSDGLAGLMREGPAVLVIATATTSATWMANSAAYWTVLEPSGASTGVG